MAEWKDTTSYSRGERGKVDPRVWTLDLGALEISVHRHIHYPEEWLMTTKGADLGSNKPLGTDDLTEAKAKALVLVRNRLKELTDALGTAES